MQRLRAVFVFGLVAACFCGFQAGSALGYNPITPSDAGQTITLNGHNLTITKLVDIARYGARVQLSQAARQRSLNAYYLLLEGSSEGMPIYFLTAAPEPDVRMSCSRAIRYRQRRSRPASRERPTTGTSSPSGS